MVLSIGSTEVSLTSKFFYDKSKHIFFKQEKTSQKETDISYLNCSNTSVEIGLKRLFEVRKHKLPHPLAQKMFFHV